MHFTVNPVLLNKNRFYAQTKCFRLYFNLNSLRVKAIVYRKKISFYFIKSKPTLKSTYFKRTRFFFKNSD